MIKIPYEKPNRTGSGLDLISKGNPFIGNIGNTDNIGNTGIGRANNYSPFSDKKGGGPMLSFVEVADALGDAGANIITAEKPPRGSCK